MSCFTEFVSSVEEVNKQTDYHLSLVDKYFEFAQEEYAQKRENADLRYISESFSDCAADTLNFLYMEAEEGFTKRTKNTINKISEILQNFISSMITKVENMILDTTFTEKMGKIAKKVKLNPFLAKKKMTIYQNGAACDLANEALSIAPRISLKLAVGNADVVSEMEDLEALMDDYQNDNSGKNEKFTRTVSEVVDSLSLTGKTYLNTLKKYEQQTKEFMKGCISVSEKLSDQEHAAALEKTARFLMNAVKISVNAEYERIRNTITELQKIIKDAKDIKVDSGKQEKESKKKTSVKESSSEEDISTDTMFQSVFESVSDRKNLDSYRVRKNVSVGDEDLNSFMKELGF